MIVGSFLKTNLERSVMFHFIFSIPQQRTAQCFGVVFRDSGSPINDQRKDLTVGSMHFPPHGAISSVILRLQSQTLQTGKRGMQEPLVARLALTEVAERYFEAIDEG